LLLVQPFLTITSTFLSIFAKDGDEAKEANVISAVAAYPQPAAAIVSEPVRIMTNSSFIASNVTEKVSLINQFAIISFIFIVIE